MPPAVRTATKEIARIKEKDEPLLEKKKEGRWAIQEKYFSQLALERRELEALYAPISTMLTGEDKDAQTRFDFSVQQSRDVDAWVKQGLSLIDGRRKNIVTNPEFTRVVEASLKAAWATGDMKVIRRELTKIYDDLKKNRLESLLLSHASRSALYDWLFGVDRIDLAYSLSYEGKPLEVLSPGTRGIVLLILYLEVDRYDRRPLIIDQPESNLDGASIYKDLVPYLRRAKQERQIIIVTHNPNLVVATDADQVIIATAAKSPSMRHPKISYLTGSLEHTAKPAGIREQVCELLEGGREAFETRERRYSDVAG